MVQAFVIKKSAEYYQKSAEDLEMALLNRYLFINSFSILSNQVLITSTQNSDFYLINIHENLISTPNQIFEYIDDPEKILRRKSVTYYILFKHKMNSDSAEIRNQSKIIEYIA